MSQRQFRNVMSLENQDAPVIENPEENLDLDTLNGDGADAALLELNQAEVAADSNEGDIAQLDNSVVALESLLESAEGSLETGGLDPVAAELLQKAVENQTAPLGTPVSEVVPALESFSSVSNRKQATVMACESISDTISRIWAKIKELIQKGRDLLKAVYIKAKQAIQGLERRIKALEADMKNRNFSLPKAQKVTVNAAWADKTLNKNSVEAIEYLLGQGVQTSLITGLKRIASSLRDGKAEEVANVSRTMAEAYKDYVDVTKLAGGRILVNQEGIVQLRQGKAESGTIDVPVLKEADLKAMIEEAKKVAATVVNYEKNFQEGDRAKEEVLKAGDELEKKAKQGAKDADDSEGTPAAAANAREAINSAREAVRSFDHPAKEMVSYAAAYLSGIGGVIATHLKAYDKK